MKSLMVCSLLLSSYEDRIKENEMGDVSSGNVEVRNNSILKPCMAETAWQISPGEVADWERRMKMYTVELDIG